MAQYEFYGATIALFDVVVWFGTKYWAFYWRIGAWVGCSILGKAERWLLVREACCDIDEVYDWVCGGRWPVTKYACEMT